MTASWEKQEWILRKRALKEEQYLEFKEKSKALQVLDWTDITRGKIPKA